MTGSDRGGLGVRVGRLGVGVDEDARRWLAGEMLYNSVAGRGRDE